MTSDTHGNICVLSIINNYQRMARLILNLVFNYSGTTQQPHENSFVNGVVVELLLETSRSANSPAPHDITVLIYW